MKYAALAATFIASFSEEQWKKCVNSNSLRRVPWFLIGPQDLSEYIADRTASLSRRCER